MICGKCPDGVAASNGGAIIILCTIQTGNKDKRHVNDKCNMTSEQRFKAKQQLKNEGLECAIVGIVRNQCQNRAQNARIARNQRKGGN